MKGFNKINFSRSERGFSLLEMLVTMGVIGLLTSMAVVNFQPMRHNASEARAQVVGFFKQTRARAISTTSAYRLTSTSLTTIVAEFAEACTADASEWEADSALKLDLPPNTEFDFTGWQVCYSARGLPDTNLTLYLIDQEATALGFELSLGGGVRELPY